MKKELFLVSFMAVLLNFPIQKIAAQCPESNQPGTHVVQKGETLYSVSRKYKVAVQDLLAWNNRSMNDILSECTTLSVRKPNGQRQETRTSEANARPAAPAPQVKPGKKQDGDTHVVQSGETLASIARLYGYTEEHFREFNALKPGIEAQPGQLLRNSDCVCENASRVLHTYIIPAGTEPPITGGDYKPGSGTHPENANSGSGNSNNQPSNPNASADFSGGRSNAAFMNFEENSMVDEINLLRSNPPGYIKYVQDYLEVLKKNKDKSGIATASELIDELKRTPRLSALRPSECVFQAAKKHGEDCRARGRNDHQGSDRSWPWDRILRECPNLIDGNENLVGGPSDVRRAVMLLLVDDKIPNRGHRKTLLNPDWQYVACYKIGQVGAMPNSWVQNFAYGQNDGTSSSQNSGTGWTDDRSNFSNASTSGNTPSTSPSTYPPAKVYANFMTSDELQMVDEINLIRSNPAAYVKYVEEFIEYMKKNGPSGSDIGTAMELIDELKKTPPLSVLEPSECVYRTAKKHAESQRATGDINHQGRDGSWPFERIKRECPSFSDGNENIVGGPSDIRRSVMLLLVDHGIDSRGHRATLLNPAWRFVGCYKVGQVGSMPNCWVQNFGY